MRRDEKLLINATHAFYAAASGKDVPLDMLHKVRAPRVRQAGVEPTEHESQVSVIAWWRHAHHGYGLPEFALYAVPNGANRQGKVNANGVRYNPLTAWLKTEGMRNGAPDLVLDAARNQWHGLRVEMKRWHGGEQSDEQKEFERYYATAGIRYALCHGAEAAIQVIKGYLG